MLKDSTDFLSGEQISHQLGVTRAAIWKTINALRKEGYPIEAIPNRGYRLAAGTDVLTKEEIMASLQRDGLLHAIQDVLFAQETDSTNLMARRAAEQHAPDLSLFVAERQLAGRGRRGRSWISDHRDGLWFSLLLRPEQALAAQYAHMTLFAGLCAAQALNSLGIQVGIKWPNDLVALGSGRKLGGILTEMVVEENRVQSLIIGIGLNVGSKSFPDEINDLATSVFLETGRIIPRVDVLAAVLRTFVSRYPEYTDTRWLSDYRSLCLTLGRDIKVLPAFEPAWAGKAIDLDADGELIVEDTEGNRRVVRSGDVSVRGLFGY